MTRFCLRNEWTGQGKKLRSNQQGYSNVLNVFKGVLKGTHQEEFGSFYDRNP